MPSSRRSSSQRGSVSRPRSPHPRVATLARPSGHGRRHRHRCARAGRHRSEARRLRAARRRDAAAARVGPARARGRGVAAAAARRGFSRRPTSGSPPARTRRGCSRSFWTNTTSPSGVETDRVREALTRFVDRDISPRDLIVVMKPLDSLFAIRLTRDRDAVRRAIESFEGRKGDYEPRNAYERDYIAGTPARIDAARSQVALSAINALAVHLGSLTDRRKTLIVATETRRPRRARGEAWSTCRRSTRSSDRRTDRMSRSIRSIRVTPPTDRSRRDLRRLADETDGGEIAADAEPGLRRVTADSSAYYLLSFRTSHPDDGQFRELQARVKRPGGRGARAQRLLDGVAGRGAARGAPGEGQRAEGRRAAGAGAARQPADPALVRHVARRERQDARDVRLGAGGARARRSRAPNRVAARVPGAIGRRHRAVRRAGRADRSGG